MSVTLLLALLVGSLVPALALPVGYDHPESDQGGPTVPDGLGWIAQCWPNTLTLAPKPAGGKLTVLFITNFSAVPTLHELNRRFPMDALLVAPDFANTFAGRDIFYRALKSRKRIDCFVFSRVNQGTIPTDVQYEVLRRVKDDGAGMVVIDLFDGSDTFNPQFLKLKPKFSGAELLLGIPYDGLRQWANTKETHFPALNSWNTSGAIGSEPGSKPFKYGSVEVSPFGKGQVVWISTNTHWERYWGGRTLLPHISQSRDMWVEADYLYSHTAKAILMASGRVPEAQIRAISPHGPITGAETPTVSLTCPAGRQFQGTLKCQLRDTWGVVTQTATQPILVPLTGAEMALPQIRFADAGRQFLDLWIINQAGETVDWGSAFVDVNRGVTAPEVTSKHPEGAPRGAALGGEIVVKNAPAGTSVRVTLTDRYWREVGLLHKPATTAAIPYNFPSAGLDGQIWLLRADVLDRDGHILARSFRNLTSPHTRATRGGFVPLMTGAGGGLATPEAVGREEYLRRIGFLSDRPYGGAGAMAAEMAAWNDVQLMPFMENVTATSDDFKNEHITDWEDPAVTRDRTAAYELLTREVGPYGLRGYNMTDDSGACGALPLGAYTTTKFHEWLQNEYGDFAAVCKVWNWQPAADNTPPDQLPPDAYVTIAFHKWLQAKYGGLSQVAKAWKLTAEGWGSMHTFGAIQSELVRKEHEAGNQVPWTDAQEFMKQYRVGNPQENPFGRIHQASIKTQYDAGNATPWIDAQRFMQSRWVENMVLAKTVATGVQPGVAVGTDAAFYGPAMSDAFGKLDYIAPYYDDRAVKVAVSRGRARRPGDYGACLGAYGEKPANMTGRRSQIWDLLFAGGNGFYYWAFGDGMNQAMVLSDKHAKYQCEVIEEIMGGIGELFTGCQRIFHPVAILDSQTSGICDQLEAKGEPLTNQGLSIGAFQYALEDLNLNPHTITSDELAAGWLSANGTKLLVLPGVNSMSDLEIVAVRDFVRKGGVVMADIRPGGRYPNGNPRAGAALDDIFGISFDAAAKARRVRGQLAGKATPAGAVSDFGEALADPRVKATTATALGQVSGTPTILTNSVGNGRAALLNASFSSYATYRTEGGAIWQPWHEVLRAIAGAAGVKPEFAATSAGKDTPGFEFSPFRNGRGYLLGVEDLGTGDFVGPRRGFEAKAPHVFHIYDIRVGKYLGRSDTLKDEVPRNGHRAYALMPYQVQAVTARVDKPTVPAGETLRLTADVTITPAGDRDLHVVRIEAFGPDGKPFFPFRRVLQMPAKGALTLPLTVALNDAPGTWRIVATDINSGKTAEAKFVVTRVGAP